MSVHTQKGNVVKDGDSDHVNNNNMQDYMVMMMMMTIIITITTIGIRIIIKW